MTECNNNTNIMFISTITGTIEAIRSQICDKWNFVNLITTLRPERTETPVGRLK